MGLKCLGIKIAKPPTFFYLEKFCDHCSERKIKIRKWQMEVKIMLLKRRVFPILLLMILPITVLFYSVSQSMDNKLIHTTIIKEDNHLICDSSTGVCGPPEGWYAED